MKRVLFLLLVTITYINCAKAQKNSFYSQLTINSIKFLSDRWAVLKAFGKPLKQFEPHYKCGFLSADEQQRTFITLQYDGLKWTGNPKDGYFMDQIKVSPASKYVLKYKGIEISAKTTWAEAMRIFGISATRMKKENQHKDSFQFIFVKDTNIEIGSGGDDKYIFYFSKGKLHGIEYWSPC